jgi:uncharacterized protein YuzB (UPF0349 family)
MSEITIIALTIGGQLAIQEHKKDELKLRKHLKKTPKCFKSSVTLAFENSESIFTDTTHTFKGEKVQGELKELILQNIYKFFNDKQLILNKDYMLEIND